MPPISRRIWSRSPISSEPAVPAWPSPQPMELQLHFVHVGHELIYLGGCYPEGTALIAGKDRGLPLPGLLFSAAFFFIFLLNHSGIFRHRAVGLLTGIPGISLFRAVQLIVPQQPEVNTAYLIHIKGLVDFRLPHTGRKEKGDAVVFFSFQPGQGRIDPDDIDKGFQIVDEKIGLGELEGRIGIKLTDGLVEQLSPLRASRSRDFSNPVNSSSSSPGMRPMARKPPRSS
jgi:hypothetical protein